MTSEERAWLTGYFEGEACFHLGRRKDSGAPRFVVEVGSVDEDVICRVCAIVGSGSVREHLCNDRPFFRWRDEGRRILPLLVELAPLMSDRRQEQIESMLAVAEAEPPRTDHEHRSAAALRAWETRRAT